MRVPVTYYTLGKDKTNDDFKSFFFFKDFK